MPDKLKPPIIIFGNTRSGTTIVQKVMSEHPDIVGWYEPHALWLYPDPGRIYDEFDESDATDKVKKYIHKQFFKYQKRHDNKIILEKSPPNILRISYVRAVFPDAKFLYIVRNPFSFISSVEYKWQRTVTGRGIIRRLKDTPITQLHYWVRRYIKQQYNKKILRKKYLSVWGPRYKDIYEDLKTKDLLTVIAKQWSECSRLAEQAMSKFESGQILRLRYEDFVDEPIPNLERICEHCGLTFTRDIVNAANELVKADRKLKWHRFKPHDLARILPVIESEMQRHGYEIPGEIEQMFGILNSIGEETTIISSRVPTVTKP
jgi:hypothetical protein